MDKIYSLYWIVYYDGAVIPTFIPLQTITNINLSMMGSYPGKTVKNRKQKTPAA